MKELSCHDHLIICFQKVGRKIVCALLFIVLFLFFFSYANIVFKVDDEYAESVMQTLYREEDETIDAFYIGNSGVYRYWQAPVAWKTSGITVMDVSTSGMPGSSFQYVAEEAMKQQNPALLIFDVRAFCMSDENTRNNISGIHIITDNMRWSRNKARMIRNEMETIDTQGCSDTLEYSFPLIRFHSKPLTVNDLTLTSNQVKNGLSDDTFLNSEIGSDVEPIQDNERRKLAQTNEDDLIDLLDWSRAQEQKGVQILFVASPILSNSESAQRINTAGDLVENYGFTFINFSGIEWFDKFEFDVSKDFQIDKRHTNIHGSLKYTATFAEYLQETYKLKDHRNEDGYETWNDAADEYYRIIEDL